MKYLIIDLDALQMIDDESRIIEFGFALLDEKSKMLKMRDNLINPGELKLSEIRSLVAEDIDDLPIISDDDMTFDELYPKIKELLEDKDTTVICSMPSRIIFSLNKCCERYSLDLINFNYINLDEFISKYYKDENIRSINSALIKEIGKETFREYSPLVLISEILKWQRYFKEICSKRNSSISKLMEEYKMTTTNSIVHYKQMVEKRNKLEEEIESEKNKCKQLIEPLYSKKYDSKPIIYLSHGIRRKLSLSKKAINIVSNKQLNLSRSISKANFIVCCTDFEETMFKNLFNENDMKKVISIEELEQI